MPDLRPWKWKEQSTRNCIHAKVYVVDGEERVRCELGRHLSSLKTDQYYGMSYATVLRRATWTSQACETCASFERDQKSPVALPYLVAVRLETERDWRAVQEEVRTALAGGSFRDVRILAVREI